MNWTENDIIPNSYKNRYGYKAKNKQAMII